MTDRELLAPAGGESALVAAVQSGADAVYLGADRFSARNGADNFTLDCLGKWIDYCHLRGVSVHLAANTLVKERERAEFVRYVSEAYRMGIDAVIIQDVGMAERIKQLMPEIVLHASTQMTTTTLDGVKALAERGFSRVILSRELTADEIRYIRNGTQTELEVFVHGALCFSYSGQCLMSSIIGQRSGNRGMCAQPCRLPYELVKNGKYLNEGYLLSPKDLCLADNIKELSDMGINSFKIEGRLKSAGYVATAVGVYRKALDGKVITDDDRRALLDTFNRSGFSKGWYGGGKDMMSGKSPSNVASGDVALEYAKYTDTNANFRKIGVDIYAELKVGQPLNVTMIDEDGNVETVAGEIIAEDAIKAPISEDRISQQLQKLGTSIYYAKSCSVMTDGKATLPVSEINAVRRNVCVGMDRLRTVIPERTVAPYNPEKLKKKSQRPYLVAVCRTKAQAEMAAKCGVKRVVAPDNIISSVQSDVERVTLMSGIGVGHTPETEAIMVMNNAQTYKFGDKKQYGGFRLNITNSETVAAFNNMSALTLSPELNLKDIKEISGICPTEVIAYGRLPLMLMRKCPSSQNGKCSGGVLLSDRRGELFPIACGEECISEIFNSKPIYMADKIDDLTDSGIDGLQLWFYDEKPEDVERIIKEYLGNSPAKTPADFTRGHFYRGFL
ncbi:MAG: U32 family peptidase [Eubacteriales bacterium]|nr:U32 family peptidase [Eubacteriales bacterium]